MLSSSAKVCFNSSCKSPSEKWRRGWRRRTGDYVHLCDPCGYAYEEGKFCELFHSKSSGWRCCESCGKRIHCGCIVSFHMFVLLDAGGIECLTCAKRSYILSPNLARSPPSHFINSQPERIKEFSMKTSNALAISGLVQRHQAPSSFSGSDIQHGVKSWKPYEINMSGVPDRFSISEWLSASPPEIKQESVYGRVVEGKPSFFPTEVRQCGNAGVNSKEQRVPCKNNLKPACWRSGDSFSNMSLGSSFSKIETDITHLSAVLSQLAVAVNPSVRPSCNHNENDSSGEGPRPIYIEKTPGDGLGRNQLMPSNHLQINNEDLWQIFNDSKPVPTPLFEKILSASDVRKVGRLVVPKKCAEAHFPPITYPEGVPIKVQDVKGKEWVLQLRFWTNNTSKMYVLEGIAPCIQSMNLRAGDIGNPSLPTNLFVNIPSFQLHKLPSSPKMAFSRLDPEGKLVISGRIITATPSLAQLDDATVMRNEASRPSNGGARNKARTRDITSFDGRIKEKPIEGNLAIHDRRNNGFFSSKRKRLKIDNENLIELKITRKEAQALMRPPAETVPSITVVEGYEFEEFEDSGPVIGRPSIMGRDQLGESFQWGQCEKCLKWRKVPSDALLPLRWICSDNIWDEHRSLCSAAEELSEQQLELLLSSPTKDSSEIEDSTKHHRDPSETTKELDTPMDKGDPSSLLDMRQGAEDTEEQSTSFNENSSRLNIEKVSSVKGSSAFPLKGQIDLNIKPEREEASSSPGSDSGFMKNSPSGWFSSQQTLPLSSDIIRKQRQ